MLGWLTLEQQNTSHSLHRGCRRSCASHATGMGKQYWAGLNLFGCGNTVNTHLSGCLGTEHSNNKTCCHSPPLCIPPSLNHTTICLWTDCVQFQNHDFVLGSLADFPAVFLEEFLADKHLVGLSVLGQTQLAELLPTRGEERQDRKTDTLRKAQTVNVKLRRTRRDAMTQC